MRILRSYFRPLADRLCQRAGERQTRNSRGGVLICLIMRDEPRQHAEREAREGERHKIMTPARTLPSIPAPTPPITNAGPALTQNRVILCASLCEMRPSEIARRSFPRRRGSPRQSSCTPPRPRSRAGRKEPARAFREIFRDSRTAPSARKSGEHAERIERRHGARSADKKPFLLPPR